MKGFFHNKQAQQLPPWYAGRSKRQEEKSILLHQQRVERYRKIHELHANKVDVATIAHQVGLSRQGVYTFLKMKQPPERTLEPGMQKCSTRVS